MPGQAQREFALAFENFGDQRGIAGEFAIDVHPRAGWLALQADIGPGGFQFDLEPLFDLAAFDADLPAVSSVAVEADHEFVVPRLHFHIDNRRAADIGAADAHPGAIDAGGAHRNPARQRIHRVLPGLGGFLPDHERGVAVAVALVAQAQAVLAAAEQVAGANHEARAAADLDLRRGWNHVDEDRFRGQHEPNGETAKRGEYRDDGIDPAPPESEAGAIAFRWGELDRNNRFDDAGVVRIALLHRFVTSWPQRRLPNLSAHCTTTRPGVWPKPTVNSSRTSR